MVRSQNLYISMYNGHSVNTCAALNSNTRSRHRQQTLVRAQSYSAAT